MREFQIDKKTIIPEQVRSIFTILDGAGFFDDGILVGSWAMLFYREVFGIEYFLRINDIDFALLPGVAKESKGPTLSLLLPSRVSIR